MLLAGAVGSLPGMRLLLRSREALSVEIVALQAMLSGVSRKGDTLRFTAMNFQAVNGMDDARFSNSLGNVIIGYDETDETPAAKPR